jgi:hypothetical protein
MRRLAVVVVSVATAFTLAGSASAWPPVCKQLVYELTGKCI